MPVVLKIRDGSEVHRVLLEDSEVTFDSVFEAVNGVHTSEGLVIKYLDEDEDLCTLCRSSFSDFWNTAAELNGNKVLKVEVFQAPARAAAPAAPPAAALEVATASSPAYSSELCLISELACDLDEEPPFAEACTTSEPGLLVTEEQDLPSDLAEEEEPQQPATTSPSAAASTSEELPESQPEGVDRFKRFTQQVVQNLKDAKFTQQVVQDFKDAKADMKEAFSSENQLSTVVGTTLGAATGVVVAARLVPVRLTRLAADSVATASGMPPATHEEPSMSEVQQAAEEDDVAHFKQSVSRDFASAQSEVSGAFKDLMRAGHNFCGSQGNGDRCVLPEVAGGLAGTLVAATLVPVRGMRLVVAKLSGVVDPEVAPQEAEEAPAAPQELVSDPDIPAPKTCDTPSTDAHMADCLDSEEAEEVLPQPASSEGHDC